MSHVHTITTDAVPFDLDTIKALCQRRGWKFMEEQKTFVWFGRFVGDSPIPEGVKVEDYGKCEHAIIIPGCKYEMGVIKNPLINGEGYVVIADFWQSGGLDKVLGSQGEGFRELYDMEKDIQYAESMGWGWSEVDTEDVSHRKLIIYAEEAGSAGGW